jgi:hypothetical protein
MSDLGPDKEMLREVLRELLLGLLLRRLAPQPSQISSVTPGRWGRLGWTRLGFSLRQGRDSHTYFARGGFNGRARRSSLGLDRSRRLVGMDRRHIGLDRGPEQGRSEERAPTEIKSRQRKQECERDAHKIQNA